MTASTNRDEPRSAPFRNTNASIDAPDGLALLMLAGTALLIRVLNLDGWYFSPDELLHLIVAREKSLVDVWDASLTQAHPPLMFILLHVMQKLGGGVLWLRSFAVAAGVAAVIMFYAWGRCTMGRTAGLTMAFMAGFGFGPTLLSQVIRPYTLLLLFVSTGLVYLDRYLEKRRRSALGIYLAASFLALLSHYSAAIPVVAAGVVLFARTASGERSREGRILLLCHLPHIVLIMLMAVSHGGMLSFYHPLLSRGWLSEFFPDSLHELILLIVDAHGYFTYPKLAVPTSLLALSGALILWQRRQRHWLLYALLCYAASCMLGVLGIYPVGGTRHCLYLLPATAILVAACLDAVARCGAALLAPRYGDEMPEVARWLLPGVVAVVCLGFLRVASESESLRRMGPRSTIEFLLRSNHYALIMQHVARLPDSRDVILTDGQTAVYFLYQSNAPEAMPVAEDIYRVRFGDRDVYYLWKWPLDDPSDLATALARLQQAVPDIAGRRVWFLNIGWDSIFDALKHDPAWRGALVKTIELEGAQFYAVRSDRLQEPERP